MSDAQPDFYQSGHAIMNAGTCVPGPYTYFGTSGMSAEEIQVRMENCRLQAEIATMRQAQADMQQKLAAFTPGYGDQVDDGPVISPTRTIPAKALRHQKQRIGLMTHWD